MGRSDEEGSLGGGLEGADMENVNTLLAEANLAGSGHVTFPQFMRFMADRTVPGIEGPQPKVSARGLHHTDDEDSLGSHDEDEVFGGGSHNRAADNAMRE